MRARTISFLAVLLTVLFAWGGVAQADFQPYGGDGGTAFTKSCGPNQYVAGFFGHVGAWLDNIGLTCAEAFGTTSFHAPVQTPQFFGGLSGTPTATQCETGTAVSHMHYFIQYDDAHSDALQYIRGISYDCAHADGSFVSNKCFGVCHDGDHSMMFTPGGGDVDNNCAPGLVTGLKGSTGQYVVALAAICGPRPQAVAANQTPPVAGNAGKPIKTTGGGSVAPDQTLVCTGGGMTVTPVSGTTGSVFVGFVAAAQGANVSPPPAGQCAWSTGPIGSVWNRLGVGTGQAIGQQLVQAAQNGGSFTMEARTLGNGIVYVDRIDSVQPVTAAASAPPAGSGYVLVCQGGGDMRISGGGATLGGPSFFSVSFAAANEAGNSGQLEPGTCAWIDRPLNSAEPLVLDVPNNLLRAPTLKQAIKQGTFQVHANNEGRDLLANAIDSVHIGSDGGSSGGGVKISIGVSTTDTGGSASAGGSVLQPPIAEDDGSGQPATIAKAVNVRIEANNSAKVLGSLAAGTSVTDLGCSKGWCHISFQGGEGFVAQGFLSQ